MSQISSFCPALLYFCPAVCGTGPGNTKLATTVSLDHLLRDTPALRNANSNFLFLFFSGRRRTHNQKLWVSESRRSWNVRVQSWYPFCILGLLPVQRGWLQQSRKPTAAADSANSFAYTAHHSAVLLFLKVLPGGDIASVLPLWAQQKMLIPQCAVSGSKSRT